MPKKCKGPGASAGAPANNARAPVSRILSPRASTRGSAIYLGSRSRATSIDLPAGIGRAALYRLAAAPRPIWSFSPWGLPCRSHHWPRGGLLHHPFTHACALRPSAVCFLLHFPWCGRRRPHPFPLGSTVPCAARTFLPSRPCGGRSGGAVRGMSRNGSPFNSAGSQWPWPRSRTAADRHHQSARHHRIEGPCAPPLAKFLPPRRGSQ